MNCKRLFVLFRGKHFLANPLIVTGVDKVRLGTLGEEQVKSGRFRREHCTST